MAAPFKKAQLLTIFSILSWQVCGLNQACKHLGYLSAKFGALNQRIKKIKSSENAVATPSSSESTTDFQICKTTHSLAV